MAKAVQKIKLSPSRDIPFNKLVLSQSNVRRVKAGISIEDLAEDIAHREKLLQSLYVRPIVDADGQETGMWEVPAGGRRYRALELLVKQKRLAKTAPVPCIVCETGTEISAEEDSLAENVHRVALHPLDQFRAFQTLREQGRSEEDIAAIFFVSVNVVKQRLRLAAVSPKLLDVYAEDGMSLEQLMAFSVTDDHVRQEQAWETVNKSGYDEPYQIKRLLTERAVRASDKRARFVGLAAYETAGGTVLRDLFEADDGGWLEDMALLERLVAEKLRTEAETIAAEGWKWIEVATDFPYSHTFGLRHVAGEAVAMTNQEAARAEALAAEYDQLQDAHADGDELPDHIDSRLVEIEAALAALDDRPVQYDPEEIARAGVFVSIDSSGGLRIERAYVRPEDEPAVPQQPDSTHEEAGSAAADAATDEVVGSVDCGSAEAPDEPEQEDGIKPIPDRLMTELTAYRTLALRDALAQDPDVAHLAALHVFCLRLFYRGALESCVEVEVKSYVFGRQAPGLNDTAIAKAVDERHRRWSEQLPREPGDLWDALLAFDADSRDALFAHCVAMSVNAVHEPWNRRPRALVHADRIADAIGLDVAAAGWSPTVDNYFGRVTKARILQAVREAMGQQAAQHLEHLKKGEMAERAEALLQSSGWLPEPLRTPNRPLASTSQALDAPDQLSIAPAGVESAATGCKAAMGDVAALDEDEPAAIEPHITAAE
ncbi:MULTISPECIES: ParB/RepB/Spo0J family partition protein [unclassified Bradyrhizobium]|uniref:ParB/RepB/Spo0J family partition protein n=1 Tax=unclassified Bradyrhizobium TaxID=2631580 RepID=UPI00291612F4|nr:MULTISPECIES: ParB/RepB/Spo0J family partition protein [unclassified Bradyrhizobium]